LRYLVALAILAGSLYILSQLQTRSGVILIALTFILSFYIPVWMKTRSGLLPTFGAFIFLAIILTIYSSQILGIAGGLIDRFLDDDFHTFWGRVHSATYLFGKVFNPAWWVPQGNSHFVRLYG